MDEALKKEFQNRIVSAGRKELLLIHLEMILAEMKLAEQARMESEERFRQNIDLTMEMVKKLAESLDFTYESSYVLLRAYQQVNADLIGARRKKDLTLLLRARKMIEQLREAFAELELPSDAFVVQNGETVYAGLTYGRNNQLKESVDYQKRGFKA